MKLAVAHIDRVDVRGTASRRQSVKPPVDAPASRARRLETVTAKRARPASSFRPPRPTKGEERHRAGRPARRGHQARRLSATAPETRTAPAAIATWASAGSGRGHVARARHRADGGPRAQLAAFLADFLPGGLLARRLGLGLLGADFLAGALPGWRVTFLAGRRGALGRLGRLGRHALGGLGRPGRSRPWRSGRLGAPPLAVLVAWVVASLVAVASRRGRPLQDLRDLVGDGLERLAVDAVSTASPPRGAPARAPARWSCGSVRPSCRPIPRLAALDVPGVHQLPNDLLGPTPADLPEDGTRIEVLADALIASH